MIRRYISLTKPGIIMGNAITAAGGFALASRGHIDIVGLFVMLFGLSMVIASGCILNNYIDRDIDKKMGRTKDRAFAKGEMSVDGAMIFATVLLMMGIITLALLSNFLTALVALIGFFVYVCLYSLWSKRYTEHSTVIGSMAGAVPPVVGYCAVSGQVDAVAILLFVILCLWQMPHFFAIALYRMDEYAAASIPVLPISKGILQTKVQILLYISVFLIASVRMATLGITGDLYLLVQLIVGALWIALAVAGFMVDDTKSWARKMFFYSLFVIVVLCIMIGVDAR